MTSLRFIIIILTTIVKVNSNVTCRNKQTVISTGYVITNHLDGLTCQSSTGFCVTITSILDHDGSSSIVSRCADDKDMVTCAALDVDKCWDAEDGQDFRTTMCCCSSPICNETPYKQGSRPMTADELSLTSASMNSTEMTDQNAPAPAWWDFDYNEHNFTADYSNSVLMYPDNDSSAETTNRITCKSMQTIITDGVDITVNDATAEATTECTSSQWCMTITAMTKNNDHQSVSISSKCVLFKDEMELCALHAAETCFNVNARGIETSFCCCSTPMCNERPHEDAVLSYINADAQALRQADKPTTTTGPLWPLKLKCQSRRRITIDGLTTMTSNSFCGAKDWCTTISNQLKQADGTQVTTELTHCADNRETEILCGQKPNVKKHCFTAELNMMVSQICCCNSSYCNSMNTELQGDNIIVNVQYGRSNILQVSLILQLLSSIFIIFSTVRVI